MKPRWLSSDISVNNITQFKKVCHHTYSIMFILKLNLSVGILTFHWVLKKKKKKKKKNI